MVPLLSPQATRAEVSPASGSVLKPLSSSVRLGNERSLVIKVNVKNVFSGTYGDFGVRIDQPRMDTDGHE